MITLLIKKITRDLTSYKKKIAHDHTFKSHMRSDVIMQLLLHGVGINISHIFSHTYLKYGLTSSHHN